ncbi:hypothetical protein [Methylobacterium nodulans]|uniref:Uncharacterized protein n=1 Tax=Methylobacterium nodulans (strain LMG 21967 / CNCM I-2342 / ORS 2060) TaxID=460265 RepID=B8IRJ6_METNO|nr:hypothetical protein [Methylobacterium nodulans]ACL58736.1 hypothetical protein Mnod_3836 [Methylobacterium nodulans ORS 2060]
MRRAYLVAADVLRGAAIPLLWIGSWATPVLRAAGWCERRAWGPAEFTPPETGRPAPTDGRAGDRR